MTNTPDPRCGHNAHFGLGVPATVRVRAKIAGMDMYVLHACDDHVPTLAEGLAHNTRQGTTLTMMGTTRLADGRTVELAIDLVAHMGGCTTHVLAGGEWVSNGDNRTVCGRIATSKLAMPAGSALAVTCNSCIRIAGAERRDDSA